MQKKRNIRTEDTTSHGENKKTKKKRNYRWVVPVLVHSFTDYDTYRLVYVNIEPSNTDTSVRATSTE